MTEPSAERRPDYLRTATSPRMLVVLVLLLGAAAVCGRLGMWQLDRAELRGDATARQEAAQAQDAAPTPLGEVLAPSTALTGESVGRLVEVRGEFEDGELLVPGRVLDGRTGYLVLTPFAVEAAEGPARLAVVRGWVAQAQDAAGSPAPSGEVTLEGFLRSGERAGAEALPDGQVQAVSPAELVNRWGGPMYSGYLTLAQSPSAGSGGVAEGGGTAEDRGLVLLPQPQVESGLDVQNLAYALQWWIFGGFAVLLWVRLVRDSAREELEDDEHDQPGSSAATAEAPEESVARRA